MDRFDRPFLVGRPAVGAAEPLANLALSSPVRRGPRLRFDRVICGPPPFAPLLFADPAALAAIAVWDARARGIGA